MTSLRPAAVILAGGRSSRMGRPKATVTLDGVTLVERVVQALNEVCGRIIVVANEPLVRRGSTWEVVGDEAPHEGPVAGLIAGLSAVHGESAVAIGCDMPFVSVPLLRHTIEVAREDVGDVAAPVGLDGRPHPLHAVYRATSLPKIRRVFEAGERRALSMMEALQVRRIEEGEWRPLDPAGRALWSVNTPGDLECAEAILLGGGGAQSSSRGM